MSTINILEEKDKITPVMIGVALAVLVYLCWQSSKTEENFYMMPLNPLYYGKGTPYYRRDLFPYLPTWDNDVWTYQYGVPLGWFEMANLYP